MKAAVLVEEAEVAEVVVQSKRLNLLDAACREVVHQPTGPLSIDIPPALSPIDLLQFLISLIRITNLMNLEAWLQWLLQSSR